MQVDGHDVASLGPGRSALSNCESSVQHLSAVQRCQMFKAKYWKIRPWRIRFGFEWFKFVLCDLKKRMEGVKGVLLERGLFYVVLLLCLHAPSYRTATLRNQ